MTTENISIRIDKLGKQINDYQAAIINTLEENNKNLKTILEYHMEGKHNKLCSDFETAKNIIDDIILKIKDKGKTIEDSNIKENILPEENLREIIVHLQEIILKLENTRYLTIEDMKECLNNHKNSRKLTIAAPYTL